MIKTFTIHKKTTSATDILDITSDVQTLLLKSETSNGICVVHIAGSTASISTIEYEEGVIADLKEVLENLAPQDKTYKHDLRWGDGNGYSHVRAALLKSSLSIPIINKELALGTWQQIILMDFDNRGRNREIIVQFVGE